MLGPKKFLGHVGPKNFMSQKMFGPKKKFGSKINFGLRINWCKEILGPFNNHILTGYTCVQSFRPVTSLIRTIPVRLGLGRRR